MLGVPENTFGAFPLHSFADKFVDLFDGNGNAISRRLHLNNHRRHPKINIEICNVNVERRVVCARIVHFTMCIARQRH